MGLLILHRFAERIKRNSEHGRFSTAQFIIIIIEWNQIMQLLSVLSLGLCCYLHSNTYSLSCLRLFLDLSSPRVSTSSYPSLYLHHLLQYAVHSDAQ